jgi:RsiW-degrading membrane proteinase PrsW (M82 family)
MKTLLHFLFNLFVIFLMFLLIIPGIIIYMFTSYNIIQEIQVEASKLEKKYFS